MAHHYLHPLLNPRSVAVFGASEREDSVGGTLYRLDSYIVGFDPGTGWSYFPSAPEVLITLSIVSLEILGYQWCVKKMPVLPAHPAA